MYLRVHTKHGEHSHPEHQSYVVGTEGELDLLHVTGVVTATYADGEWILVTKVLEEGESWISPGVESNLEDSREGGDETEDGTDEEDENFWPPFR